MKFLINRIAQFLKNKRGESLIEVLVSIMMFSIFIVSVTAMLNISFHITSTAISNASENQSTANSLILEEYIGSGNEKELSLKDEANGIEVSLQVKSKEDGVFIAFTPKEGP